MKRLSIVLALLCLAMPALAADDTAALIAQGRQYEDGNGVARDILKARALYISAAEKGDVNGMVWAGRSYEFEPKDRNQEIRWMQMAADHGAVQAMYVLGAVYGGNGPGQDIAKSARWFLAAAEKGDVLSAASIGDDYYKGTGVAQSDADALRWYLVAANGHVMGAAAKVAAMYREGRGTAKDEAEAARWQAKEPVITVVAPPVH